MKKMNKKGFTLAELLIVVAIIAVLVAIAIPVFNAQLKKSQLATDAANVRSAYAEAVAAELVETNPDYAISIPNVCKYCTAAVDDTNHKITVTHNGDSSLKSEIDYDSDLTVTIG